jgi:hypothetical protein
VCGGKEDYGVRESREFQKGTGRIAVSRQKGNFYNGGWGGVREVRDKETSQGKGKQRWRSLVRKEKAGRAFVSNKKRLGDVIG